MKRDRIENAIRHIQTATDVDPWARDLAVEALKAQLSEEETISDCISRQAAIDALQHIDISIIPYKKAREYADATISEIRNRLKKLPSVQPEPSTEIQEILDYLDTTLHPIVSPDNWNVYAELHDMVSMLPSVQPEIIYCKDCKHYNAGFECLIEGYGIERNKNWYCADAERRTDG